jgi:hypothetical protein
MHQQGLEPGQPDSLAPKTGPIVLLYGRDAVTPHHNGRLNLMQLRIHRLMRGFCRRVDTSTRLKARRDTLFARCSRRVLVVPRVAFGGLKQLDMDANICVRAATTQCCHDESYTLLSSADALQQTVAHRVQVNKWRESVA